MRKSDGTTPMYTTVTGYPLTVTSTPTLGSTLSASLGANPALSARIINTSANTVWYGSTNDTSKMVPVTTGTERFLLIEQPGTLYFYAASNSDIILECYR